jgi:hypothetical protein
VSSDRDRAVDPEAVVVVVVSGAPSVAVAVGGTVAADVAGSPVDAVLGGPDGVLEGVVEVVVDDSCEIGAVGAGVAGSTAKPTDRPGPAQSGGGR